jgi:hypothetical protein
MLDAGLARNAKALAVERLPALVYPTEQFRMGYQ